MAKQIKSPRRIRIAVGDTLRFIAARELSDAARWIEIAEINDLRPPYIVPTTDPAGRLAHALIYGDWIRLPVTSGYPRTHVYAEDIQGIDIRLEGDGTLGIRSGDFATLSGRENLGQALRMRLKTPLGELLMHRDYGCNVYQVLGMKLAPVTELLTQGFVNRAIRSEPRIQAVRRLETHTLGDVLRVQVSVLGAADNTPVDLNLVYPLER